jgi:transcriptional regulator with XRE-family HTH domain
LEHSDLVLDSKENTVGADIRALRKSRDIRLIQLAAELGRSTGWLSQIERGQTEPAISDLRNIATYFDIPLSFFFRNEQAAEGEQGFIVRKSTRGTLGSRMSGLVEELLSPHLSADFEMLRSEFEGGAKSDWINARPTQEGGYIIKGRLNLWVNDKKFELFEGDSFQFQNEKYRWENPTETTTIAFWVVSPSIY